MIQNGTLYKSILSIFAILLVAGCGQTDTNSAGLTIDVLPQQSFLLPGTASGCVDYQNLKVALTSATTSLPTLNTSISQLRVSFPRFRLTWANTTSLYVAYMSFTIKSANFTGGSFTYNVAGSELSALLGRASNTFTGKADMVNSTDLEASATANGTIYSNDSARDCASTGKNIITGLACTYHAELYNKDYSACGLQIGGISLVNSKVGPFTAPFTLRLIGYSMNANYEQKPLQSQITGTISYSGIQ